MNALATIEVKNTDLFITASSVVFPSFILLGKIQKWREEARFIRKESTFFSWIVYKSHTVASGAKKEILAQLHLQFFDFRDNGLSIYQDALALLELQLMEQTKSKYPPANIIQLYGEHHAIERKREELDTELRELKIKAFDYVDEFLSMRIF